MSNELIKVKVSFPAWSESAKSWHLLTQRSESGTVWSGSRENWFPKKTCNLEESEEKGVGILTLPEWLFKVKREALVKFTTLDNEII